MTKMIGFIKFGKGCVRADSVQAIERGAGYVSVNSALSNENIKMVKVYLNTGVSLTEQFETETEMEKRYKEVCGQISECVYSAHTPTYEVD